MTPDICTDERHVANLPIEMQHDHAGSDFWGVFDHTALSYQLAMKWIFRWHIECHHSRSWIGATDWIDGGQDEEVTLVILAILRSGLGCVRGEIVRL